MAETKPLSGDDAIAIWETLIANGAVDDRARAGIDFGLAQCDRFITEYRFMGNLGFGGKFWRNDNRWYVTCYRENETPELKAIIEKTNKALAELKEKVEKSNV